MHFGFILSNSFKYPLSDYKKLLILSIPMIILELVNYTTNVFEAYGMGVDNYLATASSASDIGLMLIILLLIVFLTIFIEIINMGISIETIKKSFNSSQLPDFNIKNFFVSGLKGIIVRIGYIIVPVVLFIVAFILMGMSDYYYDMASFLVMFSAILLIVAFVLFLLCSILQVVAYARLAETNSLSEAFDIKNIYNIAGQISMLEIFAITIIFGIISGIITIIFALLVIIPVIGVIIFSIYLTYVLLASARLTSLVYQSRFIPNVNPMYNPGTPNYQSRYADNPNGGTQQQGYIPPNQGYLPPNPGEFNQYNQGYQQYAPNYQQPNQGYYQPPNQGYNQPQQGNYQQNNNQQLNPNHNNDNSQNYYQPNNTNDENPNQFHEDDSIIKDKKFESNNNKDLDFKNVDSKDKDSEN